MSIETTVSLNFSLKILRISAPNLATMIQHVPDDAYLPTYKNLSTFATWPRIRHNRLLVVVPVVRFSPSASEDLLQENKCISYYHFGI